MRADESGVTINWPAHARQNPRVTATDAVVGGHPAVRIERNPGVPPWSIPVEVVWFRTEDAAEAP